ncbi:MAG: serine hydrolase domain-containing protein [Parvularculaceae bacterium]
MRKTIIIGAVLLALAVSAARAETPVPDAAASDPAGLGWMQGTPPAAEKRIAFADGSYFTFPKTRWSFSNWRTFYPTAAVRRGAAKAHFFPRKERGDLEAVTFTPLGRTAPMTWKASLAANYTDGIVVLHRGRIVYERYFGVTAPQSQHIAFSVAKSFVGVIAASLIAEGVIDETATVARYAPELAASGFGDASVRHVLDMTTAVAFDEHYGAPDSTIALYSVAGRLLPRPVNYQGPEGLLDFAATLPKAGEHGERFAYRTVNTDLLAWIVARASGKTVLQHLEERFWSKLGMEEDASVVVVGTGTPFWGGGLALSLRDLARFGELMRLGGKWKGEQLIPEAAIADILKGGDRAGFAKNGAYPTLPGWSYRNQWWIAHDDHGAFMARGIHGQAIYIDPKAEMVIARFASHPLAGNVNLDPTSLPAYRAIAAHLTARR